MKLRSALAISVGVALAGQAFAQTAPAKTPAAAVGVIAYPAKGQDASLQMKDEGECFTWSKQQSGYDPASPPPVATAAKVEAPPQQANGSRARGAVRGAAAGAVVGEIANNDADEGAKVGAAAGVVAGGSRNRQARRANEAQADSANQQAQAAADQANAQSAAAEETFKKSLRTCLEGKGYTVVK